MHASKWFLKSSPRIVSSLCLSVALLAATETALADRERPARQFFVSQITPAGATPHFPGFDSVTGNVLVSNVSSGTVTEVEPGIGPVRTFQAQALAHTVKIDAPARRAYVVNKGANTVSVLDLISGNTFSQFSCL